jgi:hypothetical protein
VQFALKAADHHQVEAAQEESGKSFHFVPLGETRPHIVGAAKRRGFSPHLAATTGSLLIVSFARKLIDRDPPALYQTALTSGLPLCISLSRIR